jgi:hypothetical protein
MNKSFLNNPLFRKILKEELDLVRNVINENYSADKIWSSMSEQDRENALLASADDNGPDLADRYADETTWDNIPADIQDTLDLSDYELANDDQIGRTNLRAIASMSTKDPKAKQIVDKFMHAVGRQSIQTLTKKQSNKLLDAIHSRERGVTKSWNPNDFGNIDPNTHGPLGS